MQEVNVNLILRTNTTSFNRCITRFISRHLLCQVRVDSVYMSGDNYLTQKKTTTEKEYIIICSIFTECFAQLDYFNISR